MSPEELLDSFFITEKEAGNRLDKALAARFFGHYSRAYFQYLIENQLVLLNGAPIKKRVKPLLGDEVEIKFATLPELKLTAEKISLDIIYEDDYLLIVNKPAGMVVHPAVGNWTGTLVNALLYYCDTLPVEQSNLRPGIVHRLDKETSGVIVTAKTLQAQQKMVELFSSRKVEKKYLAICLGKPWQEKVCQPIGRHPVRRKEQAIIPEGKEATSLIKVIQSNDKLSLVEVQILTGRTHQIRVHLKSIHAPVLGDSTYGNPSTNLKYKAKRQFLHASSLKFFHPFTQKTIEVKADLPEDMATFIAKQLR